MTNKQVLKAAQEYQKRFGPGYDIEDDWNKWTVIVEGDHWEENGACMVMLTGDQFERVQKLESLGYNVNWESNLDGCHLLVHFYKPVPDDDF